MIGALAASGKNRYASAMARRRTVRVAGGAASVDERPNAGGGRGPRAADSTSTEASATSLVVHRSPQQQRLVALQKEHERLLRDIAKKKQALQSMEALASELMTAFFNGLDPLRAEMETLVRQLRRAFETLLGEDSRLNRRDQAKLRSVYADILESLPPELLMATQPPAGPGASSPDDDEDSSFDFEWDEEPSEPRGRSWQGGAPGPAGGEAGYSAPKPNEAQSGTLRTLFRRLATLLHPDKVQDEAEKAERTTVMKDLTSAYEAGDLARLVELERLHMASTPRDEDPDAVTSRVQQLTEANRELRRQLRALAEERKAVRDSLPFTLDLRAKSRLRERGMQQLESIMQGVQAELEDMRTLHDAVERLAGGKIGLREFLASLSLSQEPELSSMMDDLIEEFLDTFGDFQPRSRPRRGSSSRVKR